jgi:hypothetical protein
MTYKVPTNLLSFKNSKTIKGEKLGVKTAILYLAPYTQNSKGINLCSHATEGCAKACLFGSGAARFTQVQQGKTNKTEFYLADRKAFMLQLKFEIERIVRLHSAKWDIAIRLNGTSDIPFFKFKIEDDKNIFELFPNVQFYDYTKNHLSFDKDLPSNYHLTFSRSENNHKKSLELLKRGFNVAVVFGLNKNQSLPKTYMGFEVINGDENDLRYKDKQNVVVGLHYKNLTGAGSKGKNDYSENDFIVKVPQNQVNWEYQLIENSILV